ncbi:MAG TPA: sugar phosphate nucleotidyltransferase [Puia sp.]|nr:sugar phosphate nucleotidyltransferase [Puia sp.]
MGNTEPVIRKAMILAAGLGTRFKPWTDEHPKALAPVNGKSLLQRNIEYLQGYGIRDVVVNVHHFADQIVEALTVNKGWGSRFTISDETAGVLETGGGLQKARAFLEEAPFVLMNVDILTDMNLSGMIADHFRSGGRSVGGMVSPLGAGEGLAPLATLAVTNRVTSRYFLFDGRDELCGWRNVTTGQERMARVTGDGGVVTGKAGAAAIAGGTGVLTQKAFSGIHVIDPAIFPLIGRTGKFSMVDLYLDLAVEHTIRGFDHSESRLIDVGKPESAERAAKLFP